MGRYRTINVDLNRQYRNDLNANFAQIEQDILKLENSNIQEELMNELKRIERESKERDDLLAGESLDALIKSINDAKNSANTAASNANLKAGNAEEQANYAKSQGDYAKNQGDYAKTKGDYANEKANLADEAAGNANSEASNLSQLKVDALTATQNANTATSNANNAATYATTQGDYAKQQADRAKDIVDGTGLLTQTDIGVKVAGFNASGQVLDKNGNVVEGKVKSVNNITPDPNGNITVPTFSGNYNDLINKPIIPSKTSELTNDSGFLKNVPDASTNQKGITQLSSSIISTSEVMAATPNAVKQVNDSKANKSQGNWIDLPLRNSWSGTLQYYKDDLGNVHLRSNGTLTVGTNSKNTAIALLPSGYIPKNTIYTTAVGYGTDRSVAKFEAIEIGSNGYVYLASNTTSLDYYISSIFNINNK